MAKQKKRSILKYLRFKDGGKLLIDREDGRFYYCGNAAFRKIRDDIEGIEESSAEERRDKNAD